jgi:cytochrome oxidase Cu insertion factor (SCO1/SenC/PrrC family)
MKLSSRAKMLLVVGLFALPVVASYVAYQLVEPRPTGNYGELLLPPSVIAAHPFERGEPGREFRFEALRGKWLMVASDSGACPATCREKLVTMRQARLALGRDAGRVERVFVADDLVRPDPAVMAAFPGMEAVRAPAGLAMPGGPTNDRAHIYLVDPLGNVMMRWPARAEGKRVLQDLKRLLKASQVG